MLEVKGSEVGLSENSAEEVTAVPLASCEGKNENLEEPLSQAKTLHTYDSSPLSRDVLTDAPAADEKTLQIVNLEREQVKNSTTRTTNIISRTANRVDGVGHTTTEACVDGLKNSTSNQKNMSTPILKPHVDVNLSECVNHENALAEYGDGSDETEPKENECTPNHLHCVPNDPNAIANRAREPEKNEVIDERSTGEDPGGRATMVDSTRGPASNEKTPASESRRAVADTMHAQPFNEGLRYEGLSKETDLRPEELIPVVSPTCINTAALEGILKSYESLCFGHEVSFAEKAGENVEQINQRSAFLNLIHQYNVEAVTPGIKHCVHRAVSKAAEWTRTDCGVLSSKRLNVLLNIVVPLARCHPSVVAESIYDLLNKKALDSCIPNDRNDNIDYSFMWDETFFLVACLLNIFKDSMCREKMLDEWQKNFSVKLSSLAAQVGTDASLLALRLCKIVELAAKF